VKLTLPLVLLAAVAHADKPAAVTRGRVVEKIVAVVNDEIILATELENWALPQVRGGIDFESAEGRKAWDEVKRKALDSMVEGVLVRQQAAELKLTVTPEEVDRAMEEVKRQNKLDDASFVEALKQQGFTPEAYRKNLRRQILELKVLNTAVRSRVSVSDDEVRTYYQQNERQLAGEKTVHLRQILIAVPPDASPDDVERKRRMATKVLELAREGRSFGELAKAYSDDELTKAEGGDAGWVGHGVLVEPMEEVIASMDPGDVRGPVRTARGWHVLQLVERKQGDIRPFEEVKDQLRKTLYDQQVEKASNQWIHELKKRAHIDIRL
jgi:parvulin-like peptidyl-prolyl isomerase